MAETLDKAAILRNQAIARKAKSNSRVSSVILRAKIAEFLNSDASYVDHLETLFGASAKNASVVARFRNVVMEDKLDELVYPIDTSDDGVCLVKLV